MRHRVTYLEAGDGGSAVDCDAVRIDLGAAARRPEAEPERDRPAGGPGRRRWVAVVAGVAVALVTGPLWPATPPPAEPDTGGRRHVPDAGGPLLIDTASVAPAPWRGVFEHHPAADSSDDVDRVHLLALRRRPGAPSPGAALLVVDATRRAFGAATATGDAGSSEVRVLGAHGGTGLRTVQWDATGYGLSLTTVGLTASEQRRLADAVELPDGPSLVHGEQPDVDGDVLAHLEMGVVDRGRGAASPWGSPLIGQSGGATIEGQLHQVGEQRLLVSAVAGQAVTAAAVRRALGAAVAVDPDGIAGITGITAAAAIGHPGVASPEARVRGWSRLILDHGLGVTIELSSDALDVAELLAAAQSLDLGRLARTTSPLGEG